VLDSLSFSISTIRSAPVGAAGGLGVSFAMWLGS
jgi:hypothetical protein